MKIPPFGHLVLTATLIATPALAFQTNQPAPEGHSAKRQRCSNGHKTTEHDKPKTGYKHKTPLKFKKRKQTKSLDSEQPSLKKQKLSTSETNPRIKRPLNIQNKANALQSLKIACAMEIAGDNQTKSWSYFLEGMSQYRSDYWEQQTQLLIQNLSKKIYGKHTLTGSRRADCLDALSVAYANQDQWESSIRAATRALNLTINGKYALPNKYRAGTLYRRAYAAFQLKNWPQAIEDFTAALELRTNNKPACKGRRKVISLLYCGIAHTKLKQWPEAIQMLCRALKINTTKDNLFAVATRAMTLDSLSNAYAKQGQWAYVVLTVTAALELNFNEIFEISGSDRVEALYRRSLASRHLERWAEARDDLNIIIDQPMCQGSNRALALRDRGLAHSNLGQLEEAKKDFAASVNLSISNQLAWLDADSENSSQSPNTDGHTA